MRRKNKININHDYPNKNNFNAYFSKTRELYNKGEYEEALNGFEKLSNVNNNLRIILIPYIQKCKRIKKIVLTDEDKHHIKNQAILNYFGWIDKLKYFTGLVSFIFISVLLGDPDEGVSSSAHPMYFILAIILAIITYLLHIFMKKFTISGGLVRCKYCGRYTNYINPNEPTFGFLDTNQCSKCERMYPMPDFFWDSWEGLEYMENRHSVPEEIFYREYEQLKKDFSKEYELWKNQT